MMLSFRTARALAAAALLAITGGLASAQEEKVLNVYNWSDYVAPDTLEEFTKRTGIKVNYDVYDSNEVLEAKLLVGKSGYDVVFPSAMPYLAREVKGGIYRKLDFSKLPNAKGVDPKVLGQLKPADPNNEYALPYLMAGTGIGYIKSKMPKDAPVGSLALLFDPKTVGSLKSCGVTVLDTPDEVLPAALSYLGRDPNSTSDADLKAAGEVVAKARPSYRYFHSSSYINDLANGAICVALGYAGDLFQARKRAAEAKNGVDIGIFLPKEGARLQHRRDGDPEGRAASRQCAQVHQLSAGSQGDRRDHLGGRLCQCGAGLAGVHRQGHQRRPGCLPAGGR